MVPTRVIVDPLLGRDIAGRFTLVRKIGSGAHSAVYEAIQRSVGRRVAIKVLRPGASADAGRFLREARLVSRIAHPSVMEVIDAGTTADGLVYTVSRLIRGRTLAEALAEEGAVSLDRLLHIAFQLCDALDAFHGRSIEHRDLKPANVMLMADDSVVVLDFGLARSLAEAPAPPRSTLIGTPAYLAPEAAEGRSDARSDLYGLGLILFELAAGRRPFAARSTAQHLYCHAHVAPPPLPHLPPRLAGLIHALLAVDPAHRPQTAAQVRAELHAITRPPPPEPARAESGLIAVPVTRRRRSPLLARRLLLGASLGLAFGFTLVVFVATALGAGS
jgi:serine/threonine protein kinase